MSFTQVSLSYVKCLLKAALRMNDISAVRMVPKRLRKNLFLSFLKLLLLLLLLSSLLLLLVVVVLSFSKSLDHIYFATPANVCAGYKLRVNQCMLNGTLETNESEECDITFTGG